MKVVINTCFGGYGLSPLALSELAKLDGKTAHFFKLDYTKKGRGFPSMVIAFDTDDSTIVESNDGWRAHEISDRSDTRSDPKLVQVVEKLGDAANAQFAQLEIREIPDGIEWHIEDYDGIESIHENHRSW